MISDTRVITGDKRKSKELKEQVNLGTHGGRTALEHPVGGYKGALGGMEGAEQAGPLTQELTTHAVNVSVTVSHQAWPPESE